MPMIIPTLPPLDPPTTNMSDEEIEPLTPNTILSAQEIDEMVSQFRLFNRRPSQQQINKFVSELPKITEDDLVASGHQDDACPICFNTFLATLAEEEVAHALDSPAHPLDQLGVTKLQNTCGHIFCRKDITKWITEGHDSCPACRRPLVTDEERQEGGLSSPGESWMRPWIVDPALVAREARLPAHIPTIRIDALGMVESDRHQLTGMYS